MDHFDGAAYAAAPAVGAASGVTLGVAVLSALPVSAPAPVKRAGKRLRTSTLALQAAWRKAREVPPPPVDRRAADHRLDVAWSATDRRLGAYADLPETCPAAKRSAEIRHKLFPDGLSFVNLPHDQEWAESDRLLAEIKADKLESDLDQLAGPDFLKEVRAAHEAFGVAFGITKAEAPPPDVALVAGPLRDLQAEVRSYALQVSAAADDDPGFAEAARAALAPIDRARAAAARQSGSASTGAAGPPPAPPAPEVTPTSPIPEVPGG